ncbi:glycoside hydrolase family 18 protein [Sphaerobolus stellatus SS14]|nr:glycoside hydrolase family 18 protein [Sphaerobolus stellatus SS14]
MVKTSRLFSAFTVLTSLFVVTASPISPNATSSSPSSTTTCNVTLSDYSSHKKTTPRFVTYWDEWLDYQPGMPDPSEFKGFNTIMLSFLLQDGPADQAQAWQKLSKSERTKVKKKYEKAGIKLMVSAFGMTDKPASSGADPTKLAKSMASWVKKYDLDGIDVDFEDFDAVGSGHAADWLSTFTHVLRKELPRKDHYLISHAPIAPWFAKSGGGVYLDVNKKAGKDIDFYNVQFYNQDDLYSNCQGLVEKSGGAYPGSSLLEISEAGVNLDKLVIGKTAKKSDGWGGYMDAYKLASCAAKAKGKGWNGGIMVWQYPNADKKWIKIARHKTWPVDK